MRYVSLLCCAVAFLIVLLFGPSLFGQVKTEQASFQLYYGHDAKLLESIKKEMKPNQIVVVDIRSLSALQFGQLRRRSKEQSAKLLAYISIGELHSREMKLFEAFAKKNRPSLDLAKLKSKVFISENQTFGSLHVDALESVWCDFIYDKAADILATGVDGIFLDTVDTVDVYIGKREWEIDRRAKSVAAMIGLVRGLKSKHPSIYVMQNRGLNLIGNDVFVGDATGKNVPGLSLSKSHVHNPDAILFEDAFTADGDWGKKIVKQLDAVQRSGEATVVALGYKASGADQAKFSRKCAEHQFVPAWSKDSLSLHLEVAR